MRIIMRGGLRFLNKLFCKVLGIWMLFICGIKLDKYKNGRNGIDLVEL